MCSLKSINDLNDLFEIWKKAHEEDGDYIKNSFCPDGFLGDKKRAAEILFICKESNVSDNIQTGGEKNDTFYMKMVFKGEARFEKYKNCLKFIAERFGNNVLNCAYMNINKRGGKDYCDDKRLTDYADKYKEYIKKEIELINPGKIIVLGGISDKIIDIIREAKKDGVEIYKYRHPSVYWKSEIEEDAEKHRI